MSPFPFYLHVAVANGMRRTLRSQVNHLLFRKKDKVVRINNVIMIIVGLAVFLAIWSSILLLHIILKHRPCDFYLLLLNRTGLIVSPFQLRWYTNRFQSGFGARFARNPFCRRIASVWFSIGTAFGVLTMVCVLVFLTRLLTVEFMPQWTINFSSTTSLPDSAAAPPKLPDAGPTDASSSTNEVSQQQSSVSADSTAGGLIPLVPGVNIPLEQLPLFFLTLIIAGVIHELGHALAAIIETVNVNGFGVFVFVIYPGAFTEIDRESLEPLYPLKKLKIYCAGIWNNFALAFVGALLLSTTPQLFWFGYRTNRGVIVTKLEPESGLDGAGGLGVGSVVTGINYCSVLNDESWFQCLAHLRKENYGHCLPKTDIFGPRPKVQLSNPSAVPFNRTVTKSPASDEARDYVETTSLPSANTFTKVPTVEVSNVGGELKCCPDDDDVAQSHLCYYYKSQLLFNQPIRREPANNSSSVAYDESKRADSSKLTNVFEYACLPARYVTDHYICNTSLPCTSRSVCVYPALFNNTKLFRFMMSNHSKPVLFIGYPSHVLNYVTVSNYVPRFRVMPTWLPTVFELFCKYLVTFSLALAVLNAVPCYSLDGQFMLDALLDSVIVDRKHLRRKRIIYKTIMCYGTSLLLMNVILALWKFFLPFMS